MNHGLFQAREEMCRKKSIIFAGNAWGGDGVNFARDWRKMFSNYGATCGPGPGHMAGTVFRTKKVVSACRIFIYD